MSVSSSTARNDNCSLSQLQTLFLQVTRRSSNADYKSKFRDLYLEIKLSDIFIRGFHEKKGALSICASGKAL